MASLGVALDDQAHWPGLVGPTTRRAELHTQVRVFRAESTGMTGRLSADLRLTAVVNG